MSKALTLVSESKETKPARKEKIWRERPITDDLLFQGTDECGRSGWFLRLTVSGLYPRRVGPYRTKDHALEVLEEFVAGVDVQVLCDLENDQTIQQAFVIEGVPRLSAPRKTR
jgi:hypothetical protein